MTSISLTPSNIYMILGFLLSLYTCVSNDVIQTLGTFLSANQNRPFWVLWIFSGTVLVLTFVLGWYFNDGDMAFGRLTKIPFANEFYWWHVLPPVVIILLTKKALLPDTRRERFFYRMIWDDPLCVPPYKKVSCFSF